MEAHIFIKRLKAINLAVGVFLQSFLTLIILLLLFHLLISSWPREIENVSIDVNSVLAHLNGLGYSLHENQAAKNMQQIFPEGACFIVTLYGLSWANLANHLGAKDKEKALKEILYALDVQLSDTALAPFLDTEVRNGVFWLGQRNLLLGKFLALIDYSERPEDLVKEFHDNSSELAKSFLSSPTHHLDSYPDLCWPTDNVTALASLYIHDTLYGSQYHAAYKGWKKWTLAHSDPNSNMPAGHLNSRTGKHLQPARGCANSWLIAVLSEFDPDYAGQLYQNYLKNFGIKHLGIQMFREWPKGYEGHGADVDSGPIIWGAGVTATGVGLAAARSQGDLITEASIRDLAEILGFPRNRSIAGKSAVQYLFGLLPVGDAFLTWGYSITHPSKYFSQVPTLIERIYDRWIWFLTILICIILTFIQGIFFSNKGWKRYRNLRHIR